MKTISILFLAIFIFSLAFLSFMAGRSHKFYKKRDHEQRHREVHHNLIEQPLISRMAERGIT